MATDKEIIDSLKTDWLPTDYYNFGDLNRVELAIGVVKNEVVLFYGVDVPVTLVTNRDELSIEFADSLNRIENNILQLKNTFPEVIVFEDSKTDWTHDLPFDFSDANRFERNLSHMYHHLEANLTNKPYTGQFIVGQQGVF